ncbi:hypothetical protein FNH22_00815 [Fulvivirga sp. M361]|uniref:hypothetical protein n=1 Tax=Fulvivirga sp. M361 TaxID=2594266 RepID=UPI00117B64EB|nr:hypothetical protein [Fulvivirga sp. M361]TRX62668.1 hypothetical protein FNH22_00815 [Fulvivirga sp. M361]
MKSIYSKLFYFIYILLKSIDGGGFPYQSTETRTFTTVLILSVLELLNVMTFFPNKIVGDQIIVPAILISLVNFALFYINKNYAKIVLAYQDRPLSSTAKMLAFGYIIITIIAFAWTR